MISDFYKSGFQVMRPTVNRDAGGAASESFAVASSFSAHIEPVGGNEAVVNTQTKVQANHRLFCSRTVDILETDQVRYESVDYQVVLVQDHNMGGNPHKEVGLLRIV